MSRLAWTPKTVVERSAGVVVLLVALLGPAIFSGYFTTTILTQSFIFGIAAASLIFLSAYGGMISLAQTALMGIAGYVLGNLVTAGGVGGESKGLTLGWDPTLALVLALVITTVVGLILGAVASRSVGIYFLMLTLTFGVIANYFFGQVTKLGGFSPIASINVYTPGWIGDIVGHPDKLYYIALGVSLFVYVLIRYLVRTPFGISLQEGSATTPSVWLRWATTSPSIARSHLASRHSSRHLRASCSCGGTPRSRRRTSVSAPRSTC